FTKAEMGSANLSGADVRDAMLTETKAQGALFVGAKLQHSDLSHADLTGADCTDADLFRANLHGIHDKDVRWTGASLGAARRTDVDRLEAEGWMAPKYPA